MCQLYVPDWPDWFVAGRDKEHSTIIYESSEPSSPLLRLGWNKQDPRYMATILMDSSKVSLLRYQHPYPYLPPSGHTAAPLAHVGSPR